MEFNKENSPLVSLISTFKDNKNMMRIIMNSALSQDYPNIEHVIMDAASKDGSIELLEEYTGKYSAKGFSLIWKSEPDKGPSDAVNKAFTFMNGEYILFFIDPFVSIDSLNILLRSLTKGKYNVVSGGIIFQKNGIIIRRWSGKKGHWRLGWIPAVPTMCFEKKIIEKHGISFNLNYKHSNDYDFLLHFLKDKDIKFNTVKIPIVNFTAGGISNGGIENNLKSIKNDYIILRNHKVKFAWFTLLCKCIRAFCAYTFASRKKVPPELIISLDN